jgi:hypothetical protein
VSIAPAANRRSHARRSHTAMPPLRPLRPPLRHPRLPLKQPCRRSGRYGDRSRHPRPPLPHSHAAAPTAMPPLRPLRPPLPAPTPAAPPQPCRRSGSYVNRSGSHTTVAAQAATPAFRKPCRPLRQPSPLLLLPIRRHGPCRAMLSAKFQEVF